MSPGQHDDVDKSLRVLIVGADAALEDEFRGALDGVPGRRGVVYFARSHREAVEIGGRRQPNLVLIEIEGDIAAVAGLSRDLQELVPGAAIAAAFKPDWFEQS